MPVLARDIYRDFYQDAGLAIEEKLFLAAKRLCVLFAGAALTLALLDFAGIHSLDGAGAFVQTARSSVTSLGDTIRTGMHDIAFNPSFESVKIAVPKLATKTQSAKTTSPVDGLAAARSQDAVALAMATPTPGKREFVAPVKSAVLDLSNTATLQARTVTMQTFGKSVVVPEAAASAEASVPPNEQIQLASLPTPNLPMQEQAVFTPDNAPPSGSVPMAMIPLNQVPLPLMKPPLSPADRLGLAGKEYTRAERCLANAVYFEARSEPIRGQMAVAQVVLNRVFSGFYPNDVCSVVYQNANRHLACQFTFACDGKSKAINERAQWSVANRIARQTLDGQIYVPEVAKSTHYHASYVHPNWVHEMKRLARYGVHAFYRPYAWGNGNEEPVWGTAEMVARLNGNKTKTAAR